MSYRNEATTCSHVVCSYVTNECCCTHSPQPLSSHSLHLMSHVLLYSTHPSIYFFLAHCCSLPPANPLINMHLFCLSCMAAHMAYLHSAKSSNKFFHLIKSSVEQNKFSNANADSKILRD